MKEHLVIISVIIMIAITLGNIMTSYYNGLQASKQLDQQYQAQVHLIQNDELLLASIKEGQKTNQEQNILTQILNETHDIDANNHVLLSAIYRATTGGPAPCPPPCYEENRTILFTANKIAFITDARFNDEGWGTMGYNATQILKKEGLRISAQDGIAVPDIPYALTALAASGTKLIIAQGFQWGNPALDISNRYPHTNFVIMTGLVKAKNVASIYPQQQQGSFLLGALAAMMTKTKTIGFIGGEKYPNIVNIEEGYEQGARYINPNIKILVDYLNDFNNPLKGRIIATAQIYKGADLLLHVADTSGQGVIEAAQDKGVLAFGAVADQNRLAPKTVLTSFVIDMDKAYSYAIKNFVGNITKPGLETGKGAPGSGIVYLAPFHDFDKRVPLEVKARLIQLTNDIISGKIIVPEG